MSEEIAICPFCNYAFPHSEINKHADDHFADAVEADRIVAAEIQRKFNEEAQRQRTSQEEENNRKAAELKKRLQEKLRGIRAQEDAEVARRAQEELDKANKGMGPAVDYQPIPIDPTVLGHSLVPKEWTLTPGGCALRCVVPKDCPEYHSVVQPFLTTLHADAPPKIRRLERIQNPGVYAKFLASHKGGPEGWFYHGCRQGMDGENSIIRVGFNVEKCVSGGRNFGTWFAYNSQYSCGGFAFTDEGNAMHLFVCRVATEAPAMHQPGQMIVVKQDMAYPSYLLVFELHSSSAPLRPPRPVVGPIGKGVRARCGSQATPSSSTSYVMPRGLYRHMKSQGYGTGVFDEDAYGSSGED